MKAEKKNTTELKKKEKFKTLSEKRKSELQKYNLKLS